ncbi:hypothetical protein [Micromonospora zamorensis]|uniref:hypothetical protein n=1 Tax=Micromonospora zamorensis TaxID=709883 RepID=UPI003CF6B4FA
MDLTRWHAARRLVAELDALAAEQIEAGVHDETPEYLDLNSRTHSAVTALPWWQRFRAPMELANTFRP